MKKNKESIREMREIIKCSKTQNEGTRTREQRQKSREKTVDIVTKNFPNLVKNMNLLSLISRKRKQPTK